MIDARPRTDAQPRVSELLSALIRDCPGDRISLGHLLAGLGERGFGLLFLLLVLPSVVPTGAIPFVSTLFGIPLAIVAGQLALGQKRPWLPRRFLDKEFARADLERLLARTEPYMARIERLLRPRLSMLTSPIAERLVGLVCMLLAILLALPILFGNFPPGFAILLMSLGLIAQDGAFILAGLIAAVVAAAIITLVLAVGMGAIRFALSGLFS